MKIRTFVVKQQSYGGTMGKMPMGMEPAPEFMSYDEVPWFRRQWFVMLMFFFLWPALIIIAVTGPLYGKARKQALEAGSEVLRYTEGGKAAMIGACIVLGILNTVRFLG